MPSPKTKTHHIPAFYGVIAYSFSHRTREIGVRMALGAHLLGLDGGDRERSLIPASFSISE